MRILATMSAYAAVFLFAVSCGSSPEAPPVLALPRDTADTVSTTIVQSDEVRLSGEDMSEEKYRDILQFISTEIDFKGYPKGLKIDDQLPEDSMLCRAGFRGGDLITSINDWPISEVQAAKNLIMHLRDRGISEFKGGIRRKGVALVKSFRIIDDK